MVAVVPRRASKIELPGGPERVGVNGIRRKVIRNTWAFVSTGSFSS